MYLELDYVVVTLFLRFALVKHSGRSVVQEANCVFQVLGALHCETKGIKPFEDVMQLNICLVR